MCLASWHIPLDAHAEVGNNVELARRLGLTVTAQDFGGWPGTSARLGVRAASPVPLTAEDLRTLATRAFGGAPIVVPGRPADIRSVAIVSGGATRMIHEVIALGLDAWVCGEAELWSYDLALDAGLTLVVTGHHASERYGVQALGGWLERRFGVETRFFDEANPF
jgi:putative NIF3 family GTP cyclohydrolase 1 type 2